MKKSTALIFICFFASAAHAESYFDILKKQYTAARDLIADTDFDEVGAKSGRVCTEVMAAYPDKDVNAFVRKITITEPGRGPLLPGKKTTKVLFSTNGEPDPRDVADAVKTAFGKREAHSVLPGSYDIKVRKTGDFLFFLLAYPGAPQPHAYGYCFSPKQI